MAAFQAAFVKTVNQVQLREIPLPDPKGRDVLLKVDYCGVCGSDYLEARAWAHDWKRFGHEIAATVCAAGPEATGVAPGDRVALRLSAACGECPACKNGYQRKCQKIIIAEQGGFGEYLIAPDPKLLVHIPPDMAPPLAAFVEPLSVVLDGLHTAHARAGESLLVIGGGFLGKLAAAAGFAFGLNVAGILSRSANGCEKVLASTGGAFFEWDKEIQDSGSPLKFPSRLAEVLNGLTTRLIVAHTAPPFLIGNYLDSLPFDTTIVNFGLSADDDELRYTVDAKQCLFKKIQLLSGFPVPALYCNEAVDIMSKQRDVFSLIDTELMDLNQLADIFVEHVKTGGKRIVAFI